MLKVALFSAVMAAAAGVSTVAYQQAGSPSPAKVAPTPPPQPPIGYTPSGNAAFDAWRADFSARAVAAGRSPTVVRQLLEGIAPEQKAIEADQNQPEFVRPTWDYITRTASPERIAKGAQKRAANQLLFSQIEGRYGVDADIVAGIWGIETNFGEFKLTYSAPQVLATLAYEGRRRAQFEGYLTALIEMVEKGYAGPNELKSSWAGALGQPQFMPDVYLSLAADWDGDGHRDIWNNTGDVLASIANYLSKKGWVAGEPVFDEARLPANFDYALADGRILAVSEWEKLGIVRMSGAPWDAAMRTQPAQLFLPAGYQGPALLLFRNFDVIKKYNNSDRYALAVALLARGFEGRGGLVRPWPTGEGALQRDQILELQTLLNGLGFASGAPDGMFGSNTRKAVRQFQQSQNLPADGFPTPALLKAVRAAALDAERAASPPLDKAAVRELQRVLASGGHRIGRANGKVNDKTKRAIEDEEAKLGLKPTGKANAFILDRVKRRLAAAATP